MKLSTTIFALTATACLINIANAQTLQQEKNGKLQVGVNAHYSDTGYKDYDNNVTVVPTFFYDNNTVYARGNQLGYNFIKNDNNELSVFAQYGGGSYDPDNAEGNFKKLEERDASLFAGASYMTITPYGAFRGQAMSDVMDKSGGTIGKLEYLAKLNKGNLTIYPSLGVQWQNDDFNDYYYGVSKKEAAKTGINQYSADSSLHPYTGLRVNFDINQDWGLFFNQKVAYNPDEVYDSPMVDSRVSASTTIGMLYAF